jgi:hypothetical protein
MNAELETVCNRDMGDRHCTPSDQWIAQEIACPLDGCGKALKLNPFVCDNSGWLK